MELVVNDGGRAAAGYEGRAGDCVVRAVAIAVQRPYQEVYDLVNTLALKERRGKRKRGISNARTGVFKGTIKRLLTHYGWVWTPTMGIGTGCRVHLRREELPAGRLVVNVSRHLTAVVDGVIHDLYNPDRDGVRCVYGYWQSPACRAAGPHEADEGEPHIGGMALCGSRPAWGSPARCAEHGGAYVG